MSLFCNMGETGESTLWLSIVVNCGSSQDGEINRQGAIMYYSNVVISYLQANKIDWPPESPDNQYHLNK